MKTILIALAATTALAGAAPAAAQYGGASFQARIGQLQTQLQTGVRSGGVTRAEAMPLRQQLHQLTALERRYATGGFSVRERTDLQNRIASLRQSIRMAARTGDDRYGNEDRDRDGRWQDRDGRWHDGDDRYGDARRCPPGLAKKNNGCLPPGQVGRDDRDGRWDDDRDRDDDRYSRGDVDSRYDRNNDGWDDRDGNRDGRWDVDSRYDSNRDGWDDRDQNRDGRWDVEARNDSNRDGWDDRDRNRDGRWDNDEGYEREPVADRGVLGQIIDRVTGTGGLRVGQRASADLGAVPYAYRNQYRDGSRAYYRSDGRQIYQIDPRTQTVVRIYAMAR